ncbi:shikimate kinase [Methanolobus bombayensis]|jgi:shikimate kinase|uniref:shikimate kinase n=1 Tax=Methanolobus bombayensis TaxID=38023 RepID=UPI001AEA26A8|nr:shikimate kinase [Methanolobus bombayensis]MBP1908219.1 shikimate kinase [Methanolobus bombayensis]
MIITLIGMPGAGKSSAGHKLASMLGYQFIDTDKLVIDDSGKGLQDIVNDLGDVALLKAEEQSIVTMNLKDNSIIATGGSVVYSEKAMNFLKGHSVIVYLEVPFGTIVTRLSNLTTRGVVGLKEKGLHGLYEERTGLYLSFADHIIEVGRKDKVMDVVNKIRKELML